MSSVLLTAQNITKFPLPPTGRIEVFDPAVPGLALRVTASGHRSFVLLYRFQSRPRRLTLGTYPDLKLAAARKKARDARTSIALGEDPAATKRVDRNAPTFRVVADDYMKRWAVHKDSGNEDKRIITKDLAPAWGPRKMAAITPGDVRILVGAIHNDRKAPIMANRTLALISKLFNFAIENDWVAINPCNRVRKLGKEQQRDRVLSCREIGALWAALEREKERNTDPECRAQRYQSAAALQLQLLTAQRRREILTMKWVDVEADWDSPSTGWWTIPARHAKNNRSHRVPLTRAALNILVALRNEAAASLAHINMERMAKGLPSREASRWVFPSPKPDKPVAWMQKAIDRVRRGAGLDDFRGHDLRRTAASHMAGMGVQRLVIKKLLNHVERDITAVYDRHSYDDEKRTALEQWAQALDAIVRTR